MHDSQKYSSMRSFLVLLLCFACGVGFYYWGGWNVRLVVKWLYPPTYNIGFSDGNDFIEGRVWVVQEQRYEGDLWMLLDDRGNTIKKDFVAAGINEYEEGFARFYTAGGEGAGLVDRSGDIVVSPSVSPIFWYEQYGDGMISKKGENGLFGFVDLAGEWVIPPAYDTALSFREGLAPVKKGKRWGYIDKSGAVVIDFKFRRVSRFSHGAALVRSGSKYGVIDRTGRWITKPQFEKYYEPWSNLIGVQKDGKVGFIDTRGNIAIDFQFPPLKAESLYRFRPYSFNKERASVVLSEANREFGFIDESGKVLFRIVGYEDYFIKGASSLRNDMGGTHFGYFTGDYIVNIDGDGKYELIDRGGRAYSLPDEFKYPPVSVSPTEGNIFTFRDADSRKVGYFTVGRK